MNKLRGHVTHMGEKTNAYKILLGNLTLRDYSEYIGVIGWIILE
jgi:hypothetical protein